MIRKWRGGCDRYVRERDSPGGNEPRTRRANIKERKQLTGLFHLPLRDVHIWFCPLLYTSTRLRDADLGLWWWYPEAERYLLGPWGWWIQSLMNNDTDFQMLHPSWIDVWCSDAHLTRAADILTKLCFSSRPHKRRKKNKTSGWAQSVLGSHYTLIPWCIENLYFSLCKLNIEWCFGININMHVQVRSVAGQQLLYAEDR